jgi:hypothetical protein
MAARSSKKTQADLVEMVKSAGWKAGKRIGRPSGSGAGSAHGHLALLHPAFGHPDDLKRRSKGES